MHRRRDELVALSSTAEQPVDPKVADAVEAVFALGATEIFHDGQETDFSRQLIALLERTGSAGLNAIADYIFSGSRNPDVVSEALRRLGETADTIARREKFGILQQSLKDVSPKIRDGAILGFAALDDPRARGILTKADATEILPELKRLIGDVIAQLDRTAHANTPAES